MNKYKKIAALAVTAVMAGSMIGMLAACGPDDETGGGGSTNRGYTGYTAGTNLRLNLGYQNTNNPASIAYRESDISGTAMLPDGVTYSVGDLKPAWKALSQRLQLTFTDSFTNKSSDAAINDAISEQKLGDYDVITGSLAKINEQASSFLDLSQYLNLMPNYSAFLDANPVVKYSLTSNRSGTAMYAAPYFDGLNDIEKYELFELNWVKAILDSASTATATTTFAGQATAKGLEVTQASATAYMGSEDWSVETTDRANTANTVMLHVKYSAALTAAKNSSTPLGSAMVAAYATPYTGTSGNIVDLMNHVINGTNGEVTGSQLANILQAYVDVAYQKADGSKFYATRSDVFAGVDAGWDADLLTALSRCVVTGKGLLPNTNKNVELIYGISARQASTQRRVDLITLAGTLYGIRGADPSRYEFAYIDSNGNLNDSRANAETYDLLAKMGDLSKEGLINSKNTTNNTTFDDGKQEAPQALMIHDYSQTQTTKGLGTATGVTDKSKYDFSPVVTPVSKWDTNDDGTHETIMRFTESWRSVKNTGLCVPKVVAEDTNKLNAVLAFIDYFFSEDGQILMTFGPEATNADNTNGWWNGSKATGVTLSQVADVFVEENAIPENAEENKVYNYFPTQYKMKAEYVDDYFIYNGEVYTGTAYNGKVVPTITNNNKQFFLGYEVNGVTQADGGPLFKSVGSYTNYARRALGTTLPFGNKNQGFEYQCTAQCALDGSKKVAAALVNGTIKHVQLSLNEGQSMWYMICPTTLPYNNADRALMASDDQSDFVSNYFYNNSKTDKRLNTYIDLIFFGFDTTRDIAEIASNGKIKASGAEYVTWINTTAYSARLEVMQRSWSALKSIYDL